MTSAHTGEVVIEVVLDEPHYREHHAEWVKTVGRGWRFDRGMINLFGFVALALFGMAIAVGNSRMALYASVFLAIALFEEWRRWLRKKTWLNLSRAQPSYGKKLRIVIKEDGVLVQTTDGVSHWQAYSLDPLVEDAEDDDLEADSRLQQFELLHTPNGYLLSSKAPVPTDAPHPAVSNRTQLYIPHRCVTPQMTRDEVVALFVDPDCVQSDEGSQ